MNKDKIKGYLCEIIVLAILVVATGITVLANTIVDMIQFGSIFG